MLCTTREAWSEVLPPELFSEILRANQSELLSFEHLIRIAGVCKRWRRMALQIFLRFCSTGVMEPDEVWPSHVRYYQEMKRGLRKADEDFTKRFGISPRYLTGRSTARDDYIDPWNLPVLAGTYDWAALNRYMAANSWLRILAEREKLRAAAL